MTRKKTGFPLFILTSSSSSRTVPELFVCRSKAHLNWGLHSLNSKGHLPRTRGEAGSRIWNTIFRDFCSNSNRWGELLIQRVTKFYFKTFLTDACDNLKTGVEEAFLTLAKEIFERLYKLRQSNKTTFFMEAWDLMTHAYQLSESYGWRSTTTATTAGSNIRLYMVNSELLF